MTIPRGPYLRERPCAWCDGALPVQTKGRPRRFCSDTCFFAMRRHKRHLATKRDRGQGR